MESCLGSSPFINFVARYPDRTLGRTLAQVLTGYSRMIAGHVQFDEHIQFVTDSGLDAVVSLTKEKGNFVASPAATPWASVKNRTRDLPTTS